MARVDLGSEIHNCTKKQVNMWYASHVLTNRKGASKDSMIK